MVNMLEKMKKIQRRLQMKQNNSKKLREFRKNMFPTIFEKVDKIRIRDEENQQQKTKPIIQSVKNKRDKFSTSKNNISIRDNVNEVISKRLRNSETVSPFPIRSALSIRLSDGKFKINTTKSKEEEEAEQKRKAEEQRQKEAQEKQKAQSEQARRTVQGGV